MVKTKHAVSSRRRKKRVLKRTKGQFGHKSKRYRQAKRSLLKGLRYAFRDRKVKKQEYRSLWIVRMNAACREQGLSYSRFIEGLKAAKVEMNRKLLATLAVTAPEAFNKLIVVAQEALAKKKK